MWDPDDAFARGDEDVLSWHSFDTMLGTEAVSGDVGADAISETTSDASDEDDLAELIDRSHADVLRLSRVSSSVQSSAPRDLKPSATSASRHGDENNRAAEPNWFAVAMVTPLNSAEPLVTGSKLNEERPTLTLRVERTKESSPEQASFVMARELPSTSEMVRITEDPESSSSRSAEPRASQPRQAFFESPTRTRSSDYEGAARRSEDFFGSAAAHYDHQPTIQMTQSFGEPHWVDDGLSRTSPQERQLGAIDRNRFPPGESVGGLELRTTTYPTINAYDGGIIMNQAQQQPYSANHEFELQLKQPQQRQPMSLSQLLAQSKQVHPPLPPPPIDRVQNDQTHREQQQLQLLEAKLEDKDAQIRRAHLEEKQWREKSFRLDDQVQHLQSLLMAKKKREDEHLQALAQKTAELTSLQTRCLTLQDANETCQAQAKQAVDEKERVQRAYLQVVYDLGKAQKQLNAISKETIAIPEKDFLLREIDQLQKDNDELQQKLKDLESKRGPGSSISLMDSHQTISMQKRIQELEDEVRKLRVSKATAASSQAYLPPPIPPTRGNQLYTSQSSLPMTGHTFQPLQDAPPSSRDRTATTNRTSQPLSLASMGFSSTSKCPFAPPSSSECTASTNRARPHQQYFTLEQFKAEAMARRGMDHPGSSRSASFPPADSAATTAPFTERQSFQLDAVQRRHLEYKLMNLQLEKDQMEAKTAKLEQAGLRTMSARSEKQRVDAKIQALAQDVGKLKLALR